VRRRSRMRARAARRRRARVRPEEVCAQLHRLRARAAGRFVRSGLFDLPLTSQVTRAAETPVPASGRYPFWRRFWAGTVLGARRPDATQSTMAPERSLRVNSNPSERAPESPARAQAAQALNR
jgi:hypothetical protein